MRIINTSVCAFQNKVLVIGFEGENERTQVRIDASEVFTEYPHATPSLTVKPYPGEAYPAMVNRDGTDVVWDITSSYLTERGECEIQLTFIKDSVVCKSYIGKALILRSLTVEGEMPTPVESWVDAANAKLAEVDAQIVELEGMVDTATDAATSAEQSASTASTAAEQAAGSAATATEKATEATNAAGTATAKAAEAALSATQANNSAVSAADSERGATAKAAEATTAAGTATAKAGQATEAAQTATEKAGDASASATAAHASEISAAESADDALAAKTAAEAAKRAAEASATQAAQSAQGASADAQTATQKATDAAASAQAASDAKTAVEQTAEQLADSLEQIEQNTQDIAELDERKANVDGYYPDMTVGNAEQLNSSKYVENSEPYTLRTSGGSSDIGNREYLDAVVGGTVAWNQLVPDADGGEESITITLESGKKYLARISGTDSMLLGSGQEITAAKGTDNVFDLTQMFGTDVADYVYGQGAAFFRKWFGKQWYPYNTGELRHVEGLSAHEMVGFNQWDEEWESGSYSSTGQKVSTADGRIRSANKIRVLPSTTYYMTKGVNILCQYDSNGDFVSFAQLGVDSASNVAHSVTMGENTHFITFASYAYYGNTYNHDICINLAHNGSRNGEYEPYEKHSYPLDSSVILRGIPKVGANGVYWDGDRYLPDGTIERRYAKVNSADCAVGTYVAPRWLLTLPASAGDHPQGLASDVGNIIANGFKTVAKNMNSASDKYQISYSDTTYVRQFILVIDSDIVTTVNQAMEWVANHPFDIVYELATPTTETAQPYHSTQWVSDWGTEEFVSTGIVPVGHETRYPANLRDKLQHLPDAASGNGSYLITQTDGQMVLTPFPAPPSTAGNYVLKATVVNGVATYTWKVAT